MKPEYDLTPVDEPALKKIYKVIYFSDTRAGKVFDISLLAMILVSTVLIMLETVPKFNAEYHEVFFRLELAITLIFTVEYLLRIFTIKDKSEYIFSPLGIIDFLSVMPFFVGLFFPALHFFVLVRMLRLLRIFRIFNLADYMDDGAYITTALKNSSRKIYIFLLFMCIFIVIIGGLMYVVEDGKNGFNSIPQGVYWAVVTITTVGYGDISPGTGLGKFLAILVMLAGYSIIAVPTGIVTQEFRDRIKKNNKSCNRCGNSSNDEDARFCKMCGEKII